MSQQQHPAGDGGYRLSGPQDTPAATPSPPPPALEATQVHHDVAPAVLTQNDTVVAGGILLVLAIAFLLVKSGLRSHLIAGKASPSAAGNAGWALFAFLLSLAATIVLGFFGNLWLVLPFAVPMNGLVVVLLIVFVVLYRGARRARR